MNLLPDIRNYVEENIGSFHRKRLEKLERLKLRQVLKRKNPYLFKAKNVQDASTLVKTILEAYLSSQEETIFGTFLEGLAIFVNEKAFNGRKSGIGGVDLEFDREGVRYIVSIKSGPNWGNSSQIAKMKTDFRRAIKILRTNESGVNARAINGCCYGKDDNPDKGEYEKLCGERFWYFISGEPRLYVDIVEPLGHLAKERNEEFVEHYAKIVNIMTKEFIDDFCEDGKIDWARLVEFNSAAG